MNSEREGELSKLLMTFGGAGVGDLVSSGGAMGFDAVLDFGTALVLGQLEIVV